MIVSELKQILESCEDDSEVRVSVPLSNHACSDLAALSIPILDWSDCKGQLTLSSEEMTYRLPTHYLMTYGVKE